MIGAFLKQLGDESAAMRVSWCERFSPMQADHVDAMGVLESCPSRLVVRRRCARTHRSVMDACRLHGGMGVAAAVDRTQW